MEDPDTTYISPNVVIGKDTVIFPNTTIYGNTIIGDGELWAGVPAKFIKKVDPEQAQAMNKTYAAHYIEYSDWFRQADENPENTWSVVYGE